MESRKGFVFYESYFWVLKALGADECQKLLRQMCEFALYGVMPESFSTELSEGLWHCFFPSLQKGRTNAENRSKREQKQDTAAPVPEQKREETKVKERSNADNGLPVLQKKEPFKTKDENAFVEDDYTFDSLTCDEKYREIADRKALEEMGIIVDCCVGVVEPDKVKKAFCESDFLRQTFKSLSKIKRHYDKIVAGCYKNVRSTLTEAPTPERDYMQHNYTPEQLKGALVDFDDWE